MTYIGKLSQMDLWCVHLTIRGCQTCLFCLPETMSVLDGTHMLDRSLILNRARDVSMCDLHKDKLGGGGSLESLASP